MSMTILEIAPSVAGFEGLMEQAESQYERSFPVEERRPFGEVTAQLGSQVNDRARILGALDGEKLLGLSIFRYAPPIRLGYLWYLCVSESARGRQVGTRLYRATLDCLGGDGASAMIFEVEPLSADVAPIYGDPVRRIRFYERLGARLLIGYEYIQPPIPPHGPVRLEVMVHLMDGRMDCCGPELAQLVEDWLHYLERPHDKVPPDVRLGRLEDLEAVWAIGSGNNNRQP